MAWAAAAERAAVDAGVGCLGLASVAGYRLYYGTNTRSYQFVTNTGLMLTQAVVLPHGGRWFFAATAGTSTNGLESDFSNEVSWESKPTPPVMAGKTWVRLTPVFGRSTNLVAWGSVTGEATLVSGDEPGGVLSRGSAPDGASDGAMTNMNTSEFLRGVDHAAAMNDRWLFIASLVRDRALRCLGGAVLREAARAAAR